MKFCLKKMMGRLIQIDQVVYALAVASNLVLKSQDLCLLRLITSPME